MDEKNKTLKHLNQEFEEFFRDFDNDRLKCDDSVALITELNWHLRVHFYFSVFKWCFGFFLIISLIYYVPSLNWNVSAIGRLAMIQLAKFWDWSYLYSANCLIPSFDLYRNVEDTQSDVVFDSFSCDFCENIGNYSLNYII